MDVASGADRHLDITFGLQVVESSSLVLLVNCFCVININDSSANIHTVIIAGELFKG